MLLSREEMSYDFEGAKFDPVRDRDMLAWMMNQFLYGEITGIQCGHWMYNAPDFEAAKFLGKQSLEEFQHVDNFLQILAYLGKEPESPHKIVEFLSTGMMPDTWEEHVSLEMAQGEGFVLMAFYALIDTIDHDEIVAILSRAVKQEERHVDFGERRTKALLLEDPSLKRRLLGLNLVSIWSVERLAKHMEKTLDKSHPVVRHLPKFLAKVVQTGETRLIRIGLLDRPLAEMSRIEKARAVAEAYAAKGARRVKTLPKRLFPFGSGPSRLTDAYLKDPGLLAQMDRAKEKASKLDESEAKAA